MAEITSVIYSLSLKAAFKLQETQAQIQSRSLICPILLIPSDGHIKS